MTVDIKQSGSQVSGLATTSERSATLAMWRGTLHRCPNCGQGQLYNRYLKVVDSCSECGQELHHHRADDAPPYFTIFVVGHIILAGVLALEQAYAPEAWVHAAIWIPATLVMSLAMLPRIKGALVGLQWAMRMHGFDEDGERPT
ncbi:MAG: DUF983 domain-containing protein [Pseudomonadota bacterium]